MAVWFNLRAWSDRRMRWEKQDAACFQNTACCLFTQAWLSRCSTMKHVLFLSNLTMKWPFAVQQGYLYQFCFFTLQEITSLRQANAELTNQNQVGYEINEMDYSLEGMMCSMWWATHTLILNQLMAQPPHTLFFHLRRFIFNLNFNTSMFILHSVLHPFPMALKIRILWEIKSRAFQVCDHFLTILMSLMFNLVVITWREIRY